MQSFSDSLSCNRLCPRQSLCLCQFCSIAHASICMLANVLLCSTSGKPSKCLKPRNDISSVSMAKLALLPGLLEDTAASLPSAGFPVPFSTAWLFKSRICAGAPIHVHVSQLVIGEFHRIQQFPGRSTLCLRCERHICA